MLAGTPQLVGAGLRRDRWTLIGWITGLVVVTTVSARATLPLYPTVAERRSAAAAVNASVGTVALFGRITDLSSPGALSLYKMSGFGGIFVAMLAILLIVRHTRADEDAGRSELLGASGAARSAPVAAALLIGLVAMVLLAAATSTGLILAGLGPSGAIAFAAEWAGLGLVFVALAALAAQVASSARSALRIAAVSVGVTYALRAVGDVGPAWLHWLTWTSPFGWELAVGATQGDHWWVLGISLGAATVSAAGALAIANRRDLGAGLLEVPAGPPSAGRHLREVVGLTWALERTSLLVWSLAFFFYGALLGGFVTGARRFLTSTSSRDLIYRLGGQHVLSNAFLAAELSIAAVLAAGFAISVVLRLRADEAAGHVEAVLATATSRHRLLGSYLVVALGGSGVLMLLVALGAGLAYGISSRDLGQVWPVVVAGLVQIPAVWVMAGFAALLVGSAPRLAVIAWVVLALAIALGEIGPLLHLEHWLMDLSPFGQVPRLPGGTFSWAPLGGLILVSLVFLVAGAAGYRRRDIG
jgi:ABC-2 type transport system permease protein